MGTLGAVDAGGATTRLICLSVLLGIGGVGCTPAASDPDGGVAADGSLHFDAAMIDLDGGLSDDTGVRDTGVRDTGIRDTGIRDTGVRDTGIRDTGARDTGPRPPSCLGLARSCSLLGRSECSRALGCTPDTGCEGLATSCYSEYNSYACRDQDGCYWSSSSSSCSGSARSCRYISTTSQCIRQDGCYTVDDCTGTPTPCTSLSEYTCNDQPGCYLQYD